MTSVSPLQSVIDSLLGGEKLAKLSNEYSVFYNDLEIEFAKKDKIILFTQDHWGDDEDLALRAHLRKKSKLDQILDIIKENPQKKFYLFSTAPFLSELFDSYPNAMILHYGDEFLINPTTEYDSTVPVGQKDFSKPWHWVYLCHAPRMHRLIGAIILLGFDIKSGLIRFDPDSICFHDSWQSFRQYLKFNEYRFLNSISHAHSSTLKHGFDRVLQKDGFTPSTWQQWQVQEGGKGLDGLMKENFSKFLKPNFYNHSVVEIVPETIFIKRTGLITEKYLNTVYGCNFPIVFNMHGSVSHLRKLGFDMFDDVVDHSYDQIADPYERMTTAVKDNLSLLQNKQLAQNKWIACQARFRNNIEKIADLYQNKGKSLNSIVDDLTKRN